MLARIISSSLAHRWLVLIVAAGIAALGVYNFNTGTSGRVVLKAPGGCTASSDAIQFVSYDPNSITELCW